MKAVWVRVLPLLISTSYSFGVHDNAVQGTGSGTPAKTLYEQRAEMFEGGELPTQEQLEFNAGVPATCVASDDQKKEIPSAVNFYNQLDFIDHDGGGYFSPEDVHITHGLGINLFATEAQRQAALAKPKPDFRKNQFTRSVGFPNGKSRQPEYAGTCTAPGDTPIVRMKQVKDPKDGSMQLMVQINTRSIAQSLDELGKPDRKPPKVYLCY